MPQNGESTDAFLAGVRVLEVADELGEYAGKVLGGLGAEVIKVEPPGGELTRSFGPFYQDEENPENSLYFWHYNFGKLGVSLNLDEAGDQNKFKALAATADVVLDTRPRGYLEARGLGYDDLKIVNPGIIVARISPFGDDGPWADYVGSDLVHLALGGIMMNCGYDPEPGGFYETPPIAPQMWQAYHVAGEMTAMAVIGALSYARDTGRGQCLSTAVHDAVSKCTEGDLPNWIYAHMPHFRLTCRHSNPNPGPGDHSISMTKDGRWMNPYRSYLFVTPGHKKGPAINLRKEDDFDRTVGVLARHGMAEDLTDPKYDDPSVRSDPSVVQHYNDVIDRFIRRFLFSREIWREFQDAGLTWAPLRRPEENLDDEHWGTCETFVQVEHSEIGRTLTEVGAKWNCPEVPWRKGPRAPHLGEHNGTVFDSIQDLSGKGAPAPARTNPRKDDGVLSARGKPFALSGVRHVDVTWILASGGAGRFLAGLGAEVIRVEHKSRIDSMRFRGQGLVPPGGRAERESATGPIRTRESESLNRCGHFMDVNAGKRSLSLNLKHPAGRELLSELVKISNSVADGFSPGTMAGLGFSYDRLKEINPNVVYVQQSGMGQLGTYGRIRTMGSVAQGFAGSSEMSGLPQPFPPAGIGYSYLDWFGAYNMATALLAGLYRQRVTGKGCWIDSSQVEAGIFLTGSSVLDYSANGRRWSCYGNRSPYKLAAPHGAYRTAGDDRWIAIGCFDEGQWQATVRVLGSPSWADDPRFATIESRAEAQDALDDYMNTATVVYDGYELMAALQQVGVPAGVCQNAEDRYEKDPQLSHLNWLVELTQTEIGTWPVKESPVKFSETPPYQGGIANRHGPNYGEDNYYILGELLGLGEHEIKELESDGVL